MVDTITETSVFEQIVTDMELEKTCDAMVVVEGKSYSIEDMVPCTNVADWRVTFTCDNNHTKKRFYCDDCLKNMAIGMHSCFTCLPALNEVYLLESVPIKA